MPHSGKPLFKPVKLASPGLMLAIKIVDVPKMFPKMRMASRQEAVPYISSCSAAAFIIAYCSGESPMFNW